MTVFWYELAFPLRNGVVYLHKIMTQTNQNKHHKIIVVNFSGTTGNTEKLWIFFFILPNVKNAFYEQK